ncbi:unnamed protein product [Durusdinium trenchii]|uniref:Uncharacterized protein n=1 Tax=Durusdinium trenchii TaxID=1381693 RepID=A0ABP0MZI4_9DINO
MPSSSSSSSEDETPIELIEAKGSSSDESAPPARSGERGMVGMWTWPCPRCYGKTFDMRVQLGTLKPIDWDKQTLAEKFRSALQKRGLLGDLHLDCNLVLFFAHKILPRHAIVQFFLWKGFLQSAVAKLVEPRQKMIIVSEPHKKWDAQTERREQHYHVVVKFQRPFAHYKVNQDMSALGAKGFWTFNLCGLAVHLHYILRESAKKIGADIDPEPYFWPESFTASHAAEIMDRVSNSQLHRNGNEGVKAAVQASSKRPEECSKRPTKRRKSLSFSEFTDLVIEAGVETEQQLFQLAKDQKLKGHDLLWNFVGQAIHPERLLARCLRAWNSEKMPPTLLHTTSKFGVADFEIPPGLQEWRDKHRLDRTLVLSGPGNCGKTALCAALLAEHGAYYFLDKLDVVKRCLFQSTTSLLVDDVCLRSASVDDAKSWLDNTVCRFASCRHEDGMSPPGMRCFTTNWDKRGFLPDEARHEEHLVAIERRMWFVEVGSDLRKNSASLTSSSSAVLPLPASDEMLQETHHEAIVRVALELALEPEVMRIFAWENWYQESQRRESFRKKAGWWSPRLSEFEANELRKSLIWSVSFQKSLAQ